MRAAPYDFINEVARARGLVLTTTGKHFFRLEPRPAPAPAWHCDLDDGTPSGEGDPGTYVRWVCPALRLVWSAAARQSAVSAASASGGQLDVRRTGPQSDLGRLVAGFRRLVGRSSGGPADGGSGSGAGADGGLAHTDPYGVLDGPLRHRIEHWPPAWHGDGVLRPAQLGSIGITFEGLIVSSYGWWGSAAVLDHHIGLAVDIADRLRALRLRGGG
jgi:hypothetical protein